LVDQSALQGNAVASLAINGKVFDTDVEPLKNHDIIFA
jgi:hypothetical protein